VYQVRHLAQATLDTHFICMKDVDRSKFYDSQKRIPGAEQAPDPSDPKKELMVLEARLERATGEDRMRIQEQIRGITEKLKKDGKIPPTT
jgi:hypothetical protein